MWKIHQKKKTLGLVNILILEMYSCLALKVTEQNVPNKQDKMSQIHLNSINREIHLKTTQTITVFPPNLPLAVGYIWYLVIYQDPHQLLQKQQLLFLGSTQNIIQNDIMQNSIRQEQLKHRTTYNFKNAHVAYISMHTHKHINAYTQTF